METNDIIAERIGYFVQKTSEGTQKSYLDFLRVAAQPLLYSTDLLYKLWLNFSRKTPYLVVSDLALSSLSRPVGMDLYRLDEKTREYLLAQNPLPRDTQKEIAHFVEEYAARNKSQLSRNIYEIHTLWAKSVLDLKGLEKIIANKLNENITPYEKANYLNLYFNNVPLAENGSQKLGIAVAWAKENDEENVLVLRTLPEKLREVIPNDGKWVGKPQEILELEREWNITLDEINFEDLGQESTKTAYSLNEKGEVNGLTLRSMGIEDIGFLESFEHLERIHLGGNKVKTIEPFVKLQKLFLLGLNYNQISEITFSFLESLPNLKALYLKGNPIGNVPKEVFEVEESCLALLRAHFSIEVTIDPDMGVPHISLIANSGIQFHKFDIEINPNADLIRTMGFYEPLYFKTLTASLEYAYRLLDEDIWVPKKLLKDEEYLDENDRLKEDVNTNIIRNFALNEEEECYAISSIFDCLEDFASKKGENIWLPIPYFKKVGKKVEFGSVAWARMMIKEFSERKDKIKKYKIVLAFDTKTDTDKDIFEPNESEFENGSMHFALSDNEDYNLHFCDEAYRCAWVADYLKTVYYRNLDDKELAKKEENPEFPYFKHLARYLYLIKYFSALNVFPQVELYTEKEESVNVDLVLDIGNSTTCGLLFESPEKNRHFNFNTISKLKLNDLSEPYRQYNDPFSMQLVFAQANFGLGDRAEISIIERSGAKRPFHWLSPLRVGKEAARLFNSYNLDRSSNETANHHSSPKRYLWDNKKSDIPWRFINRHKEYISVENVTEHFDEKGELAFDVNVAEPLYSKKSLMTFVYIEIFLHAISQINSYEFRDRHANPSKPRRLRRVTITCPTTMTQHEQVVLRQCAAEAIKVLNMSFSESVLGCIENEDGRPTLEIVPNPKDLAKNSSQFGSRKDWIYDEATCGQLAFLYGEVSQKYFNKAQVFFDLYGKKRTDVTNKDKKALTIGSIDIGAGNTNLMICAYQYEENYAITTIKPQPLFWESFDLAGDDLLKEIIQQIILEGKPNNDEEIGCKGVIENAVRAKGISNVMIKLNDFFGVNSNRLSYTHRIFRKNFIVQVAVPIALRYLEHATENKADCEVGYEDLFLENRPNKGLIDYFNAHFKIKFEEIRWKLSTKRVFSIVEMMFDPIFKPISAILSAYGCDFVTLAGKTVSIPKIQDILIEKYPVSPDRIINLNKYRIGKWYPFNNGIGYSDEPKSIVAVGASIALMAELGKLDGFRLDTQLLRSNLIATSDYIGTFDKFTHNIDIVYLDPNIDTCKIEVHSLPMILGYKQMPNANYRGRPIYKLGFNNAELRKKVISQNNLLSEEKDISEAVDNQVNKLKQKLPFKITLKRQMSESKEHITIERIEDVNREDRPSSILNLSTMTLAEERAHWLETGEFLLNIKA